MNLPHLSPIARAITQLVVTALLVLPPQLALAAPKAAVFAFELQHGDLVPGTPNKAEAETRRLETITTRLRERLAGSGMFEIVDIAPVAAKAAAANLQSCGGCADDFAREVGADYAFTGVVFKVSELVLSINVFVHEAATGRPVTSGVVDLRGNTDESWSRAINYLYKNLLGPRLAKQIK